MTDCNEYKQISSLSGHLPDNSRQFIDEGLVRSGTMAILVLFNYRKYPDKAFPQIGSRDFVLELLLVGQ